MRVLAFQSLVILSLFLESTLFAAKDIPNTCLGFLPMVAEAHGKQFAPRSSSEIVAKIQPLVLSKLNKLLRGEKIDELYTAISELNEKLLGAFQLHFFEGVPFLTYVEAGQSYYFENSRFKMREGPHPIQSMITKKGENSNILKKRFQPPNGYHLVGIETDIYGNLIPLFAKSTDLVLYRDLSEFTGGGEPASQAETRFEIPRQAAIVPLNKMKFLKLVEEPKVSESLPNEIRELMYAGYTLVTENYSPRAYGWHPDQNGLEGRFPEPYAKKSEFQALIISSEDGKGRTGVILKDGVPLITRENGQEYFLEIKGIGIVHPQPDETTPIGGELTRLGRITVQEGRDEGEGEITTLQSVGIDPHLQKLRTRYIQTVALPELNFQSGVAYRDDLPRKEERRVSGQAYRLATTTRRLAFAKSPPFGTRYTQKPQTLEVAQYYYGKMMADLLSNEMDPSFHDSPHAENLMHFPIYKVVLHTDYGDIDQGFDLNKTLASTGEYRVFENGRVAKPFYFGFRNSLIQRGLWTSRLEDYFEKPQQKEADLMALITSEIIDYFRIRYVDKHKKPFPQEHPPLPVLSEFDAVWIDRPRKGSVSVEDMNNQTESMLRSVTEGIRDLENLRTSTFVVRDFDEQLKRAEAYLPELRQIQSELTKYIEAGRKTQWTGATDQYAKEILEYFKRMATVYDQIGASFGLPPKNFNEVKKMAIFKK